MSPQRFRAVTTFLLEELALTGKLAQGCIGSEGQPVVCQEKHTQPLLLASRLFAI